MTALHTTNSAHVTSPAADGRPRGSAWLRAAYGWRPSAYALAAPVVGLAALPLLLIGRSAGYRWQRRLAVRLLDAEIPEASGRRRFFHGTAHSVSALPLQILSAALAGAFWALFLARGVCYPLAEWGNDVSGSWGGPTMAGAWAAHFGVGLLTGAVVLPVVALLVAAQRRLAVRLLGGGPAGVATTSPAAARGGMAG